jgi:hypothetical protein
MKLKAISKVKNKSEAQSIAVAYQNWSSEHSMSYGELIKYNHYFEALGKKFKLIKEFKENGINR